MPPPGAATTHHRFEPRTIANACVCGALPPVFILLVNAVAVLSEDRFLARINLSTTTYDPAFGAGPESQSFKAKLINGIASVRTVMRSTFFFGHPRSLWPCFLSSDPPLPPNQEDGSSLAATKHTPFPPPK